jgi:hypothetical protein
MIRHAHRFAVLLPVLALTVAMIEPPFRAALMTLVGAPALLASCTPTARLAAITMSPVAMRTEKEGRQAIRAKTSSLHQYRVVRRHATPQAVDNATGSCQPKPVCLVAPSHG